MRFTVTYHGKPDFRAGTYDEAYSRILERNTQRQKACGFRLSLGNYEVHDGWDTEQT